MVPAQFAHHRVKRGHQIQASTFTKAVVAVTLLVAALVFPSGARAATGALHSCAPNSSCEVGEFLYDDAYSPITTASCNVKTRNPDGTLFLNNVAMTASAQGDGWYSHTFTAPAIEGIYRTQVCCTAGSDFLCIDKSFNVDEEPTSLSTDDIASSVWTYSSRTLTTFGTLIADIWKNATRTLTGADLTSGKLATQSDVDSQTDKLKDEISKVKTEVTNVQTQTNITNISNITSETRNLLEQIINKPIIETAIEEEIDLQSKLNETESLATELYVNGQYINSKTMVLASNWRTTTRSQAERELAEIDTLLGDENSRDQGTVFGKLAWFSRSWNFGKTDELAAQAKTLKRGVASVEKQLEAGNYARAYLEARRLQAASRSLASGIGEKESSRKGTLLGEINETLQLAQELEKKIAAADSLLAQEDFEKPEVAKRVNNLAREVLTLNRLPKSSRVLGASISYRATAKEVKNRLLSLRGLLFANQRYLVRGSDRPLASVWIEEGSMVFKILITNPSTKISQTVPIKYYLPKEVREEHIVSVEEGLEAKYDIAKDEYYVVGEYKLSAGETKTLSVKVEDSVFTVSEERIASLRQQAEALAKPLEGTAYFAQGATLKSEIDASLDRAAELVKNTRTPDAKIRAYREAMVEIKKAEDNLEALKAIATQAGSVGTLFGFVGGSQTLAVWGLILIMVTGFVFLGIYMRNMNHQQAPVEISKKEAAGPHKRENGHTNGQARQRKVVFASFIIAFFLGVGGTVLVVDKFTSRPASEPAAQPAEAVLGEQEEVPEEPVEEEKTMEEELGTGGLDIVKVVVPAGGSTILRQEAKVDSAILAKISSGAEVVRLEQQNAWTKILYETEKETLEGWVRTELIKGPEELGEEIPAKLGGYVTIKETSTGWLRVREKPWGEELTRVNPGERYILVDEQAGWVQIELSDGSLGWVYGEYVSTD